MSETPRLVQFYGENTQQWCWHEFGHAYIWT